jgi:hypothetical protein
LTFFFAEQKNPQTLIGTRAKNQRFGDTSFPWATPMAIRFRTFGAFFPISTVEFSKAEFGRNKKGRNLRFSLLKLEFMF